MSYNWDFSLLWQYQGLLLTGLYYTLWLTVVTSLIGLAGGLLVAVGRIARKPVFSIPLVAITEFFRCTPLLVQLVWCYYALPMLIGVELTPTMAAVLTLSLYGASFYGEIIRAGLSSIERGQWDAGRALGMTSPRLMRYIIMPQALKRMVPPLVSQTILQLKNTSLVSVVAVSDLLYQGQIITAATYRPLEVYTIVAVMYFMILFPSTQLANLLEYRLRKSD